MLDPSLKCLLSLCGTYPNAPAALLSTILSVTATQFIPDSNMRKNIHAQLTKGPLVTGPSSFVLVLKTPLPPNPPFAAQMGEVGTELVSASLVQSQ